MIRELDELSSSDIYPFHMPGHKRQKGGDWLDEVYARDITEIDGFDNLQQPAHGGIIASLEERLAGYYGCNRAHLLVGGSTTGILASISATVPHRGRLLMDRHSHQSVYNAAFLGELFTEYLQRPYYPGFALYGSVREEDVAEKLKAMKERDALPDAVIITSPTYEGFIADTEAIAKTVHGYGIPLIVDGAHGAHLNIPEGADITIVSLHKTLPAMTQTAAVLVRGTRDPEDKLKAHINMFQTTSPSYILMSSVEKCLDIMERDGEGLKARLEANLRRLYSINDGPGRIKVLDPARDLPDEFGFDRSKINVYDKTGRDDGRVLYDALLNKYALQPEMAGIKTCLLMGSVMDTNEGYDRLIAALEEMGRDDI